jgi:L-threonylcarbamoyladenylate synthase
MSLISNDIKKAAEFLNHEDVVSIPTETVYGLAGNIFSEKAINKIFTLKKRPLFNPLIVHTHGLDQLSHFVSHIPPKAKLLAEAFWPGPLTLILPKKSHVPDLVTAGKDTVGIRVPNHPATLALLKSLDFPLAAPSANPFGSISPTRPFHVANYFGESLSMVLDGGECQRGIESTIVGFEDDAPVLYRLGSVTVEDINAVLGGRIAIKNKKEEAPDAPGMLSRHYAPDTHTFLVDNVAAFVEKYPGKKIGILRFQHEIDMPDIEASVVLSPTGDLQEAASKLYAAMHWLDNQDLDMLVVEKFPEEGLGKSINDRLERASKR